MNTYDFDKTIYRRDSSVDFWLWCLRRHFALLLPTLPKSLAAALRHARGRLSTKELKEQRFSFLPGLDARAEAALFWESHKSGVGDWYLAQRQPEDLILSASPEFLLRPIADELGVRLIATPMDPASGRILGLNCHDTEKVRRFRENCPGAHTEAFYSDSLSDTPMAELADRAWLIRRGKKLPWPGLDSKETL